MMTYSRLGQRIALRASAVALLSVGVGVEIAKANPYIEDDFPFQIAAITVDQPEGNLTNKGIAIDVGNGATMLFDIDMVRVAGGWTGGFITEDGVSFSGAHGGNPRAAGEVAFGVEEIRGWSDAEGSFEDGREAPFGPIDPSVATWKGIYTVGQDVVLTYSVGDNQVAERPGSLKVGETTVFTRTISVESGAVSGAMRAALVSIPDGAAFVLDERGVIAFEKDGLRSVVALAGVDEGVGLLVSGGRVLLSVEEGTELDGPVTALIASGPSLEAAKVVEAGDREFSMVDYKAGGPSQWREPVVAAGEMEVDSTPDGAYVVDRIPTPVENPWDRRVRLAGFDFFSSDQTKAAFSTWDGDVWIVEGIDEDLDEVVWTRFASGLFEPLGLKIVDDEIYVSSRVGLMKIQDLNNDGWADAYESFNHELTSSNGFHEFVFDLHTDPDGWFYFAKAGPVRGGGRGFGSRPFEGDRFGHVSEHAGSVVRVSPDGKEFEVYATGFRAPNGIGVGPDGQVTTGDNEGTWIPACPLNWVEKGGFYGVEDLAHRDPIPEFDEPLCWLAKPEFDNSGGGQVWVTSDQWGPFEGELLHMSYGQCALYLVMKQEVDGQMQGGVVQIPVSFASSAMRARFNEKDGQLYVAGLRGWQTRAASLSGFDRVRYTGKQVVSARDLKVDSHGIHLTFTTPLDRDVATDGGNFAASQWNYNRSSNYGSGRYSVYFEGESGADEVEIETVSLSEDGKTLTIKVDDLAPVDQFLLEYNIETESGEELRQETLFTIHQIPEA